MRALVLGLVALLLLSPTAAADHVFSHRVYVVGRVIDVDGLPAAGMGVSIEFHGIAQPPTCGLDPHPFVTGAQGDFVLCYHYHALPANVTVTVTSGDASGTVGVGPFLREANVSLQLGTARVARDVQGDRDFNATLRVHGRLMEALPSPEKVEGVLVNATPQVSENVTARLMSNGAAVALGKAVTDEMGHFDIVLTSEQPAEGAFVFLSALDSSWERAVPLAPAFHRVDALLLHGETAPTSPFPGTSKTPWGGAPLALAVLACAALLMRGGGRGRPRA